MEGRAPDVSAHQFAVAAAAGGIAGLQQAGGVGLPPGIAHPPLMLQQTLSAGQTEEDLPDPGPSVNLCFDYVNNQRCSRLRSGQFCKYRHLPPGHPDVIADRVKQGKITPQMAAELMNPTLKAANEAAIAAAAAAVKDIAQRRVYSMPPAVHLLQWRLLQRV